MRRSSELLRRLLQRQKIVEERPRGELARLQSSRIIAGGEPDKGGRKKHTGKLPDCELV